jgi:site-specific DNA recombinase
VSGKLKSEIRELEGEIATSGKKLSNPEKVIDDCLKLCSNLSELWISGGYDEKVKLQQLLFPEGLLYERENDYYRTPKVNEILELIRSYSSEITINKNGQPEKISKLSASVVPTGIEPVLPE